MMLGIFLRCHPPYFWRQDFPLDLGLTSSTRPASQKTPRSACLCPTVLQLQMYTILLNFQYGFWGLNSGPCA